MKTLRTLLAHSWLSFWRSKTLTRSLTTTIFTWFMMGLIMLYALGLGIMLPKVLTNISPDRNPIDLLNSLLFFYWMNELLFRLIFQRNVTLNIQYYLTQRISGYALAHFMLLKSWVNLFLLITLLLFAPFAFGKIVSTYGPTSGWIWFGFLFAISLFLHHFVVALHQLTKGRSLLPLVLGASILIMGYLNIAGYVNFTFLTDKLMTLVLANPLMILGPLLLSAILYFYVLRLIVGNLYLDHLPEKIKVASANLSRWVIYLNSHGTIGQLIALELRLIWRNKRPRSVMVMGVVMMVYFMFILMREDSPGFMKGVILLLATGIFMINYGQLLFSWESNHFDFTMTRNFKIKTYLSAKFFLFLGFNTFLIILIGIGLVFIDTALITDLFVWYLVNSGFYAFIFIWGATLGPKSLNANARAMFNYEGMNAFQFIVIIPYLLLPMGMVLLLNSSIGETWTSLLMASIGLLGLIFYKLIISSITEGFLKRKHKILHGFRD